MKIRTKEDIHECISMYLSLSDESFLPSDYNSAYKSLFNAVRTKHFVRCIRENNVIVAWIYCEPVQVQHMKEPVFQQIYYCSLSTGRNAVRYVKILHDEMIIEAKKRGLEYCTSTGSHMDPSFVFARILEKNGWQRRGFIAVKHLDD